MVSTASDSPALSTAGLGRAFGPVQAVTGVTLSVDRGEMFGLVGPDGGGKSTLIRLLCGILTPSAGQGTVLGRDLVREPEAIKARIGYLSQAFTLYGDLTVDENIEFFADIHGVRGFRSRRDELLDFTRLTPFRARRAEALSGGMKKKLALACTLIHTPQMILLDEPSTGVDPVSRGEFWNILSDLLAQGVTIFMTTPYLDEAERCHRLGLMHRGRIIRTGTPDALRAALPGQVYRLDSPNLTAAYRALRQRWPADRLVRYGDRLHFWTHSGAAEARTAAAELEQHGLGPVVWREITPSLEDVFIGLLGAEGDAHEKSGK